MFWFGVTLAIASEKNLPFQGQEVKGQVQGQGQLHKVNV